MTIFALVLGAMTLLVAVPKLLGIAQMQENLGKVGVSLNIMRALGALEVAAAVGLQFDSLRTWAAGGLVLMMVGAIGAHTRARQSPKEGVPAFVFLVLATVFVAVSV